jgi:hypothetical protein
MITSITMRPITLVLTLTITGIPSYATNYIIDATSYGVSTSNADNTSDLNSALTAASGYTPPGVVQIPCGVFTIGGTAAAITSVSIPAGVGLIGSGRNCTKLVPNSANTSGNLIQSTGNNAWLAHLEVSPANSSGCITTCVAVAVGGNYQHISDIQIDGGGPAFCGGGCSVGSPFTQSYFKDSIIYAASGEDAVYLLADTDSEVNFQNILILACQSAACGQNVTSFNAGFHIHRTTVSDVGGVYIDQCRVEGSDTYGVEYDYSTSLGAGCVSDPGTLCAEAYLFVRGTVINAATTAIYLLNAANVYITPGNFMGSSSYPTIELDGTVNVWINNNAAIGAASNYVVYLKDSAANTYLGPGNNWTLTSGINVVQADTSNPPDQTVVQGEVFQNQPAGGLTNYSNTQMMWSLPEAIFSYSQLPSTARSGSQIWCSDCTAGACSTSGAGAVAHYTNSGLVCAAY